jgi:hypothetical protein
MAERRGAARARAAAWAVSALLSPLAAVAGAPVLEARQGRVAVTTDTQRAVFTDRGAGYALVTYVRDGRAWRPLFDAGRPLLEGPLFGDLPTGYRVVSRGPGRVAVEFHCRHAEPRYDWTMRAYADTRTPLIRFTVTCRLREPMKLTSPQPTVALWSRTAKPAYHLDQGPDSIYGSEGIPFCYGFPAAYLWDDGREAAVFVNMTPMRWMHPNGVARFHDVRIMTRTADGQAGLGMHLRRLSGPDLPAGDMVTEFYLHQRARPKQPTGMEALDTMVRAFAPIHPMPGPARTDAETGRRATWSRVARRALADLMKPGATMAEIEAPWLDEPLALVPARSRMVVHPATSASEPGQAASAWDFSTVNNHLTPWLLLARLSGDARALRTAVAKLDALPRFYDPRSGLIRHGTRRPPHVGDLEMSWQNLFFHLEALRASSAAAPRDFNPAVTGRVLVATTGLRDLARRCDYVLPQWFDPYDKKPAVQNDVQGLGVVREPWQVGSYALVMVRAFEITGRKEFLDEAERALVRLMEAMAYDVKNACYDRRYAGPHEFPITELFGNAYGIAAAYRLYEETGQAKHRRYARDFLNTLLRLTFWYEDETDPVSRDLRNAGLFYPHGGAHVATPWETSEAHLMIAWTLRHDTSNPLTDLLLRLLACNWVHAFGFFPATWSRTVRALDLQTDRTTGSYFPVEPFYCLEGTGGHRGQTAAYMAGLALWNAWLYDALAEATDPAVMVANLAVLEGYEDALSGADRRFIVYNPGPGRRDFRVRLKHVPEAAYTVSLGPRRLAATAATLRAGVRASLAAGAHVRLTVRRADAAGIERAASRRRSAENALSTAYWLLQRRGSAAATETAAFAKALRLCRSGKHAESLAIVRGLVRSVQAGGD